jgi:protein SCO1
MRSADVIRAIALAGLLAVAGCGAGADAARDPVHEAASPEAPGGDLSLTDQDGGRWTLTTMRGRAALVFFGYTRCADACPIAMSKIRRAAGLLGDDAKHLAAVFVSVDPARDTPAVLKQYVGAFTFPLIGLTGTRAEIDSVAQKFGVKYAFQTSDSAAGYSVSHTTTLFLVDRQGRVRHRYPTGSTPAQIAEGVKHVLTENR